MNETECSVGLVGCPTCKGKCQLMGLGSIKENCPECNGVGWIEKPFQNYELSEGQVAIEKSETKKKGRPKKELHVS